MFAAVIVAGAALYLYRTRTRAKAPSFSISIVAATILHDHPGSNHIEFMIEVEIECGVDGEVAHDWSLTVYTGRGVSHNIRAVAVDEPITLELPKGGTHTIAQQSWLVGITETRFTQGITTGSILFRTEAVSIEDAQNFSTKLTLTAKVGGMIVRSPAVELSELRSAAVMRRRRARFAGTVANSETSPDITNPESKEAGPRSVDSALPKLAP